MRGKGRRSFFDRDFHRITPAYAGKSCLPRGRSSGNKDHPRLCGEKLVIWDTADNLSGSPPPMRGKVARFIRTEIMSRITPAYAGKSFSDHS